jgi:hypothetical protein
MLTVLNSKDRNRAFLKFITLFFVTTLLIVTAAYVDFRGLPESRRNFLEQKFQLQRIEMLNQEEFVVHMEKARVLLDSFGKNENTQTQVEILLTGKLNDMERTRQKDSGLNAKLDARILESFMELQRMKNDRSELAKLAGKARALEQKLEQCEAALDTYRSRPQSSSTPVPSN